MDYSRCCMFCKKYGPFLNNRLMLIYRLKLMFATDTFDAVLLKNNICLICAGRILQVFDFYMVKSNVDKLTNLTSGIKKCSFCLNKNIIVETDVAVIKNLAIQTKLIQEENLTDQIFCCYGCYNFLHEFVTLEKSLVKETEIFIKQISNNMLNPQLNEQLQNNIKNTRADVKENNDKSNRSKNNTKKSRKNIVLSARSRSFSKKKIIKTNFTESNEKTPAKPPSTVKNKDRCSTEIPFPMTRLPFQILPTSDAVVKIEHPEKTSFNEVSVPTVLDTINISGVNLPSQPLFTGIAHVQNLLHETQNESQTIIIPQINKTVNTINSATETTEEVSSFEQNVSIDDKLKSQITIVMIEQDTAQQQLEETNQHKVKGITHQDESDKNKLIKQAILNEVTVDIEPLVYKSKKIIQKATNPKKSNVRTKRQLKFQKNALKMEGEPKKQKTLEEWRLEFNLLQVEVVVLERCDMVAPVTTVLENVRGKKAPRGRKRRRKDVINTKTTTVERCNNIQKLFNDGDFNLPDPTEIIEDFLYYSHQSTTEERENMNSNTIDKNKRNKNGCYDNIEYNEIEYLDDENSSIIKSSLAITKIEFLEPRKDGFQYFEIFSDV